MYGNCFWNTYTNLKGGTVLKEVKNLIKFILVVVLVFISALVLSISDIELKDKKNYTNITIRKDLYEKHIIDLSMEHVRPQ